MAVVWMRMAVVWMRMQLLMCLNASNCKEYEWMGGRQSNNKLFQSDSKLSLSRSLSSPAPRQHREIPIDHDEDSTRGEDGLLDHRQLEVAPESDVHGKSDKVEPDKGFGEVHMWQMWLWCAWMGCRICQLRFDGWQE